MTDSDECSDVLERLREQLKSCGVDASQLNLDSGGCIDLGALIQGLDVGGPLKVMCLAGNLRESVDALGDSTRDNVVMVRVDEDTVKALDAWVEAGAVKSRSAAAAVFIREGLKVRDAELKELEDALQDVQRARQRLREKAEAVLGPDALEED